MMICFKALLVSISLSLSVAAEDNSTVCYDTLGCFPNDGPWINKILRPSLFFKAPQSPDDVGTEIYYFSKNNKEDGTVVYQNQTFHTNNTGFHGNKTEKIFFIVHGFRGTGNNTWMSRMKDAIFSKMDAGVFLVDWGKGAATIFYPQAASNSRIAGAELGRFIKYLQKNHKLNASSVHLIGHSLGAHVASYAAKSVKGIGRLTGLDAAQPGFEGMPALVRIDQSDADFVDLIHTNTRPFLPTVGFGLISAVGHVDIYVNGGIEQPGCYTPDGVNALTLSELYKVPIDVLMKWVSCSHAKSHEYFTAGVLAKCKTWARKSGKARSLLNAVTLGNVEPITSAISKCSSDTCTEMGLATPEYQARGVFAATTIRQYPYCDAEADPDYDRKIEEEIKSSDGDKHLPSSIISKIGF